MRDFIKVLAYDKCSDDFTETFINPDRIYFLTTIVDSGNILYMVYFQDLALRITPDSYINVVRELYGEDY